MFQRDIEEEKTVKCLKLNLNQNKEKCMEAETENELLKEEITKLSTELEHKTNEFKEDYKNRQLLADLYENGVIDEDGNLL